jgi:hypothetical protein
MPYVMKISMHRRAAQLTPSNREGYCVFSPACS